MPRLNKVFFEIFFIDSNLNNLIDKSNSRSFIRWLIKVKLEIFKVHFQQGEQFHRPVYDFLFRNSWQ